MDIINRVNILFLVRGSSFLRLPDCETAAAPTPTPRAGKKRQDKKWRENNKSEAGTGEHYSPFSGTTPQLQLFVAPALSTFPRCYRFLFRVGGERRGQAFSHYPRNRLHLPLLLRLATQSRERELCAGEGKKPRSFVKPFTMIIFGT